MRVLGAAPEDGLAVLSGWVQNTSNLPELSGPFNLPAGDQWAVLRQMLKLKK